MITQQAIFYGVVFGLIYAVFAAGFVLVYRCTGILNFAQGEIGAFGVALFALFHVQYDVPVLARVRVRDRRHRAHRHGDRADRRPAAVRQPAPRAADRDGRRRAAAAVPADQPAQRSTRAAASRCRSRASGSRPTRSSVLPREILVLIVAPVVIIALGAVHDADVVRPRGARVVVERRHRAGLRHQRQAHVDDRVDDRRPRSRRSPASSSRRCWA